MNQAEYVELLDVLDSARRLRMRLSKVFYRFGHGIYQLISSEDLEFIDGLSIEPVGNFQRNDGSEDVDQLLVNRFALEYLDTKYDFHFRTVPAGPVNMLRGEILVSIEGRTDIDDPVHLARLVFDERGDLVEGPKLATVGIDNITSKRYCSAFTAQLLYNHLIKIAPE